jgi:hypothetical protein
MRKYPERMKGERKMRLPTVHLNGTGREMLVKGYEQAYEAIRETSKALSKIEFNARDYYVQGPEAWQEAVEEMHARHESLRRIEKEIEEILIELG